MIRRMSGQRRPGVYVRRMASPFGAVAPADSPGRAGGLFAQARQRLGRVRTNALLIVQVGVAASLSWWIADDLLGHSGAFFAPIAAVIVLGASVGHRLRRGIELVVGVGLGIAAGDLLVLAIGVGPVQLGLVVALAVAGALFLGSGPLLINQAAASAVLITTLFPPTHGIYYGRWVDALVGGAVAFAVQAILLPLNPLSLVRKTVDPVLALLTHTLSALATILDARDLHGAEVLLAATRRSDPVVGRFHESLQGARELVAVSPIRFRARGALNAYLAVGPHLDHAVRNTRVLVRHAAAALRNDEPVPPDIIAAIEALADAFAWLGRELAGGQEPDAARGRAATAMRLAYNALASPLQLSATALVAQARAIAFDIMLASGLDQPAARAFSRHARKQATN
jgi:hypothetical protein